MANGELLTVRHPQALAARLEKILQQIRLHGFAQSRLNVSIAILPEQTATPLLQNCTMIGTDAKVVEDAVERQGSSLLLHANKMDSHPVEFRRLTLPEAGDFKHKISAMSNAALFHCRSDLVVLNGEQTAIKSHLNPAIADLENQLPGALLDVTVLPLKSRLLRLDLRIHAHNSTTMWSCDVTDDRVCVFRGPTRIRPAEERDTVLFIVSAKATKTGLQIGSATKGKVAYPDDPYATRKHLDADNATSASKDQKSVGDSASAIRLHDDFGWSPAIQPRTIVAYVNNKPITVLDIVPVAHELFQFSIIRRNDSDPKELPLESAIRNRAPEYLYRELLLQHFQAFATEEPKVSLRKHCEEQFLHWKDQVKRKEKRKTDDELHAWLLSSQGGVTLDGLQKSFNRTHTAQGYAEKLAPSGTTEDPAALQDARRCGGIAHGGCGVSDS